LLSSLGSGVWVPLLIPSYVGKERSDVVEVECSWSGMTGGDGATVGAIRVRGYALNSGVTFSGSPLAPSAARWAAGRILMSRRFGGTAADQNGDFIFANDLTVGRGVAQFSAFPNVGMGLIDPVVVVGVIVITGVAYTGGTLVFERVSFYNSKLEA